MTSTTKNKKIIRSITKIEKRRRGFSLLFLFLCWSLLFVTSCKEEGSGEPKIDPSVGGDFTLQVYPGKEWKLSENLKKVNLIFFGYTSCPDYCPMTLTKYKKLNQLLGDKKEEVQYIFISVDDKRDNPEMLKNYVEFYVDNGVGLTGKPQNLQKVLDSYKASFSWNGEFIEHSTYTYLVDENLKTRYIFRHADSEKELNKILRLFL